MWDRLRKKLRRPHKGSELYYATHYHLVPLYVISGLLIVAVLIMGCYVRFMWETQTAEGFQRLGDLTAQAVDNQFLPSVVNPADKKQYVYPASLRFSSIDPYEQLRYSYDPGTGNDKNGASIGVTTSTILRDMEAGLSGLSPANFNKVTQLQECSKLYVIRFLPGSTPYGGFTPLTKVVLKDGRTAYIHKNTYCLTEENDGGLAVAHLEKMLATAESY